MDRSDDPILAGLNPRQREAVLATEGPLLVVAGAGSGKTRMLTVRVAHLVRNCGVPPEAVLAVTFTNKAAREMKERIRSLVPDSGDRILISTFHAFCVFLLRRYSREAGFPDGFTIYDEDDSKRLMKTVLEKSNLDPKRFGPGAMLEIISQAKNDLLGPEEFKPPHFEEENIRGVYRSYQKALAESSALDFDDLLFSAYKLLNGENGVLEKVRRRFRYFLVDEYQDTNFAQYKLVSLLSAHTRNLCVVGDEDQSIYSWRGATIRNIREFEKDFSGARTVILDQNYRSTQIILDAAGGVIANNVSSKKKKLWTTREGGEPLKFHNAMDEREEADWIARRIISLRDDGIPLRDFAVLFRLNSLSRAFEQALTRLGVPYEMTGGTKFFLRKEVKDILAYLRVIVNPNDSVSLNRIINIPKRGIGEGAIARLGTEGTLWELVVREAGQRPGGKIGAFHGLIEGFREYSHERRICDLARHILEKIDYFKHLEGDKETYEDRKLNIESLVSDIRSQEDETPGLSLAEYLERVALHSEADETDDSSPKVHMMTLHNAKGLEFPVVFMTAMEEGIFPHSSSRDSPSDLEEERRLAYVGMTRAKARLFLSAARRRLVFGTWTNNVVSRFITEIPRGLVDTGVPHRPGPSETRFGRYARPSPGGAPGVDSAREDHDPTNPGTDFRASQEKGGGRIPRFGFLKQSQVSPSPVAQAKAGVSGTSLATMTNTPPGTIVSHAVFGQGVVREVDGNDLGDYRLTIEFENVGKKTLLLQYANLRVINSQTLEEVKGC